MAVANISTDFIRLRNASDQSPATGLAVALLPEGGAAPSGLVSLTANGSLAWQYDFPVGVTNGKYTVYVGGLPLQVGGVSVEIMVIRDGVITAGPETNFITPYDGF